MDNYSLSDLAVATGNGGVFGGSNWGGALGGGLIGYLLGASTNGGGLFGNGGNRAGCVTEADLCTSQNFNNLQNAVGRISDNQAAIARQTDNAICQIGYQNLEQSSALGSKIDGCCCNTQLGIQSVKFDMANYASAIQMSQMQGTHQVLDKLCSVERALSDAQKDATIAQQGQRINQLENDLRFCRIPVISNVGWTVNPVTGCTTGCGQVTMG